MEDFKEHQDEMRRPWIAGDYVAFGHLLQFDCRLLLLDDRPRPPFRRGDYAWWKCWVKSSSINQ